MAPARGAGADRRSRAISSELGILSRCGDRGRAAMLAEDHQIDPEAADAKEGPEQPREIEELRLAVGAMEVMHRHLRNSESAVLNLLHHLDADDAAVVLELNAIEHRPPHQPEI